MAGAGGQKQFIFTVTDKAVVGKMCRIGFTYARSWDLPDDWQKSPQKSFTVKIVSGLAQPTEPTKCGQETIRVNPMMEGKVSLDERNIKPFEEIKVALECQGKDCIETEEKELSEWIVVSSDPNCPIIGFKLMHDDENGIPTH